MSILISDKQTVTLGNRVVTLFTASRRDNGTGPFKVIGQFAAPGRDAPNSKCVARVRKSEDRMRDLGA